jgi:hypothetical protein
VNSLANLYAGALCQFTMVRMDCSGLCIFYQTFYGGAEGFKLMYFHLKACGISVLLLLIVVLILLLIVVLIWVWYLLVGSVDVVWRLFVCRK